MDEWGERVITAGVGGVVVRRVASLEQLYKLHAPRPVTSLLLALDGQALLAALDTGELIGFSAVDEHAWIKRKLLI